MPGGPELGEPAELEISDEVLDAQITDTVLADAKAWQHRPLERVYPIVYLDALIVKIRDGHAVEAIEAAFPAATVQTCLVHQVRSRTASLTTQSDCYYLTHRQ